MLHLTPMGRPLRSPCILSEELYDDQYKNKDSLFEGVTSSRISRSNLFFHLFTICRIISKTSSARPSQTEWV